MEFFRQEYWSGLPFPTPVDLPDPEIEPTSPASPALGFFTTEPPGKPNVWLMRYNSIQTSKCYLHMLTIVILKKKIKPELPLQKNLILMLKFNLCSINYIQSWMCKGKLLVSNLWADWLNTTVGKTSWLAKPKTARESRLQAYHRRGNGSAGDLFLSLLLFQADSYLCFPGIK